MPKTSFEIKETIEDIMSDLRLLADDIPDDDENIYIDQAEENFKIALEKLFPGSSSADRILYFKGERKLELNDI